MQAGRRELWRAMADLSVGAAAAAHGAQEAEAAAEMRRLLHEVDMITGDGVAHEGGERGGASGARVSREAASEGNEAMAVDEAAATPTVAVMAAATEAAAPGKGKRGKRAGNGWHRQKAAKAAAREARAK